MADELRAAIQRLMDEYWDEDNSGGGGESNSLAERIERAVTYRVTLADEQRKLADSEFEIIRGQLTELQAAARELCDSIVFEASTSREEAQRRYEMHAPMVRALDKVRGLLREEKP